MNVKVGNFQDLIKTVTPVCDTSAYAAGDTLFDRTAIVITASQVQGGIKGRIASITIIDKDDQAAAGLDLYFLKEDVAFGTINAVPSISDANAEHLVGRVRLSSADWTDLGGVKYADLHNLNIPFMLAAGSTTLYVAGVTLGTPTQTASGLVLRITVELQDGAL